jgi:hypothetical protein
MDLYDRELDDVIKLALQQPAVSVQQKQRAWERLERALEMESPPLAAAAEPLNRGWLLARIVRAAGVYLYQLVFEEHRYEQARRDRHTYPYSGFSPAPVRAGLDLMMPFRVTVMHQVL